MTFHEIGPELTRVLVVLEYHPQGLFERTGNLWRAQGRRARLELKHFRRHVMTEASCIADEVEGWRGEIHDGEVTSGHEDRAEEQDEDDDDGDATRDEYDDGEDDEDADDEDDDGDADDEYDDAKDDDGRGATTTRGRRGEEDDEDEEDDDEERAERRGRDRGRDSDRKSRRRAPAPPRRERDGVTAMTSMTQTEPAADISTAGRPSGLADVVEMILDKGLVIDIYVRVSLVGIELLTIDARIVIASVDTYLRFAEATNRLDLYEHGGKDLPELFNAGGGRRQAQDQGRAVRARWTRSPGITAATTTATAMTTTTASGRSRNGSGTRNGRRAPARSRRRATASDRRSSRERLIVPEPPRGERLRCRAGRGRRAACRGSTWSCTGRSPRVIGGTRPDRSAPPRTCDARRGGGGLRAGRRRRSCRCASAAVLADADAVADQAARAKARPSRPRWPTWPGTSSTRSRSATTRTASLRRVVRRRSRHRAARAAGARRGTTAGAQIQLGRLVAPRSPQRAARRRRGVRSALAPLRARPCDHRAEDPEDAADLACLVATNRAGPVPRRGRATRRAARGPGADAAARARGALRLRPGTRLMGLFSGLVTLPLLPVRGVVWLAEQLEQEALEWTDPDRVARSSRTRRALAAGELTDEARAEAEDALLAG